MSEARRPAPPRSGPNCTFCKHHFVTYEPQLPHGCRAFGIKTRGMPSVQIRRHSGADCQAYEERPRTKKRPPSRPADRLGGR